MTTFRRNGGNNLKKLVVIDGNNINEDVMFITEPKEVKQENDYKIKYTLDRGLPLDPNTQVAFRFYKRFKNSKLSFRTRSKLMRCRWREISRNKYGVNTSWWNTNGNTFW